MHKFWHFLRIIILLFLLALGIYEYQNNENVRTATNDSLITLHQRLSQLLSTGSLDPPKLQDQPRIISKNGQTDTSDQDTNGNQIWSHNSVTVYVDINNRQLRSAAIDAISAWNRTGSFLFKQVNQKKHAKIIISVISDSDTQAAGQTSTTYNPVNNRLLKAHVELNHYYLQNSWYGYSYNRIVNTVEHELGHAIGLKHTKKVSVMYPAGSYYTIQPRDIQAVKKLYHEK